MSARCATPTLVRHASCSFYDGVVAKLFTRGREDVIAIWNNGTAAGGLRLDGIVAGTSFTDVNLLTLRLQESSGGEPDRLAPTVSRLTAPPASVAVEPLQEFVFLSVVSDRPGFAWLGKVIFT